MLCVRWTRASPKLALQDLPLRVAFGLVAAVTRKHSFSANQPREPKSKPGMMKVSKGQSESQPEIVAAAFLSLYMVLGGPF